MFPDLLVSLPPLLPSFSLYTIITSILAKLSPPQRRQKVPYVPCHMTIQDYAAHLRLLFFCLRHSAKSNQDLAPTHFLTQETHVCTTTDMQFRLIPSGLDPRVLCLLLVSFTGGLPFVHLLNYVSGSR